MLYLAQLNTVLCSTQNDFKEAITRFLVISKCGLCVTQRISRMPQLARLSFDGIRSLEANDVQFKIKSP